MDINEIKETLQEMSEQNYKEFSLKLINNSDLPLLGVRRPNVKKLAIKIYKSGNANEFLKICDFSSIEMCIAYAYVLSFMKCDIRELLLYFDRAAAHVDNWCTCDTLCECFKQCGKHLSETLELLISYFESGKTYYMRIAAVMLMTYYLTDEYIDEALDLIGKYENADYYYKMGAAWFIATALAKQTDKTLRFMETCAIDDFTYNKAISKAVESRRITPELKQRLKKMKKISVSKKRESFT